MLDTPIDGLKGLGPAEIVAEIRRGGRFVFFEYCISVVVLTLRRPSAICFLRGDERGWVRGLPYTILSFLLGWWGLPWGVVYTPLAIATNLAGGCDVTQETCVSLGVDLREVS